MVGSPEVDSQKSDALTFNIVTMGCKVNTYDTSLLEKQLTSAGFTPDQRNARVQILNSCAVTENSTLDAHRNVKRLKKLFPESLVVITGCVAQVDVERLTEATGADLIVGNSHKGDLQGIIKERLGGGAGRVHHSNIFKKEALDEGGGIESSRTRAFLKIQDGCNSFCSFCIIPFARGKSRSLSKEHLVARVNDLHSQGFQEVVLTGVHCGDYEDGELDYAALVESVLVETKIPRVRLSSLEPIEVTPRLWKLFRENPRLCPHIHVSLQSANTKVLKDMKRKYGQEEIKKFFDDFQANIPHGYIGMDVIVGFPGETEEEFCDTYDFLSRSPWTRIHVFPYSIRPGTLAAKKTGHLQNHVIQLRARQLRALSRDRQREMALKQVGTAKPALILDSPSMDCQGLTRDYWPTHIVDLEQSKFANREIPVEITGIFETKNGETALSGVARPL